MKDDQKRDSNISRRGKVNTGHLMLAEDFAKFRLMCKDYGCSVNHAINRLIDEAMAKYRIPGFVQKAAPEWDTLAEEVSTTPTYEELRERNALKEREEFHAKQPLPSEDPQRRELLPPEPRKPLKTPAPKPQGSAKTRQ